MVGRRLAHSHMSDRRRGDPELLRYELDLASQLGERQRARLAVHAPQRHAIPEDVVPRDLLVTAGGPEYAPLLGEPPAALHVELMLVTERTHETPAGAGDLR